MSRTLNAPGWGMGAVLAGAAALALMALLALGPAPRANAAFTTGKCAGPDIVGEGASFARKAHEVFNTHLKTAFCVAINPELNVQYEAEGSGAGRRAVKFRDREPRFGMSDEPPSPAEIAQMNAGTGEEPAASDADPSDNGEIHVIPAAVGAVAPLVNFPDACDPADLFGTDAVTSEDEDLVRVRFTKEQFEGAWAKAPGFENWDDVFPDLECEDVPIIRIVRFDDSGTSFAFKDYLNSINPGRGWLTTFAAVGARTREWPEAVFGDRDDCGNENGTPEESDPDGPGGPGLPGDTDQLTSGCSNGNGALVDKLIETDGSIGYSDIATARDAGLTIDPAGGDNDVYWTQVQNGSIEVGSPEEDEGEGFVEPTAAPGGFEVGGDKGANCGETEFDGVPATTFEDWAQATGVNSEVGYGICTMTYGLVFDDNADVWGNTPAEEAKARTVKDYWQNIIAVSEIEESPLFENDYSPLPPDVLVVAKAGVEAVEWNKGEGGSGGPGGGGGGGDSTPPPAGDSSTPPPPPVSNLFSLTRRTISSKTGQAIISVKLPGAGKLVLVGTAKVQVGGSKSKRKNRRNRKRTKTIKVGQVVLNANKAGTFSLTLKPSGAAKKELRKRGRLRVNLKTTFTPTGGAAKTSSSAVTLKLNKPKKKKKSAKRR